MLQRLAEEIRVYSLHQMEDDMSGSRATKSHSTFDGHHLEGVTLLKASQTSAYLVTLNPDNTLTERSPFGGEPWSGEWQITEAGDLIIKIGPYTSLYVGRKLASGGYLGAEGEAQMMIWILESHHNSGGGIMNKLDTLATRVGLGDKGHGKTASAPKHH
jgi:hypothetical protein